MSETQGPPDEIDAILNAHEYDTRAAIASLIEDRQHLYRQLELAQSCISAGFTRGWRFIQASTDEQ